MIGDKGELERQIDGLIASAGGGASDDAMAQMMASLGMPAKPAGAHSLEAMAAMGAGPTQPWQSGDAAWQSGGGQGGMDAGGMDPMAMMQSMMAMMGGGGGMGGGNSAKDALVAKVKAWQKKGQKAKEMWWAYCSTNGTQHYDPNRHDEAFLTKFLTIAETSGEAMIDASGGETKKKDWTPGSNRSGANDDPAEKEQLVLKVKEWQRSGNVCKELWYTYVTSNGTGTQTNYDPSRHDIAFLSKFLEYAKGPEGQKALEEGRKQGSIQGMKVDSPKLFVGGLPQNVTEDMVTGYFSQFGNVQDFNMKYSPEGVARGYGFITFDSVEAAQLVMDNYDSNMIENKWIDCKPASETKQKQDEWGDDGFGGKGGGGGGYRGPPPTKTELCRHFKEGYCQFGFNCNFAHGEQEIGMPNAGRMPQCLGGFKGPATKTELCRHFQTGYCQFGFNCNFAHGEEEIGQPNPGAVMGMMRGMMEMSGMGGKGCMGKACMMDGGMCGMGMGGFGKGKGKGGGKPGDWTCPSCGDLVFSWRGSCKMCGAAKPDAIGDGGAVDAMGGCGARAAPY